ncbi:hypothetical protein PIIN_01960 [Serendipita indica DSM 11827]|uniref:Uncharacterized protein n=1 Tax=Serendipita indica (strain DSM 11827) TaxID=1109443 RepID=G4T9T9_SERID|nr:hypothetical protein PIIN_01960 [Serendipita indica DSM 11827]
MSSLHTHLKAAADAFPDGMEPSIKPLRDVFLVRDAIPGPVQGLIRPHLDGINDHQVHSLVAHHPEECAETLRTIIIGILKTAWWNDNVPRPDEGREDPFDQLVEGPNRDVCVFCGSNNGKACAMLHLEYTP